VAGLVYTTGHFRNGILLAPVTARIAESLVTGDPGTMPDIDLEAFRPGRFASGAAAS
jgi:glycine oxidase